MLAIAAPKAVGRLTTQSRTFRVDPDQTAATDPELPFTGPNRISETCGFDDCCTKTFRNHPFRVEGIRAMNAIPARFLPLDRTIDARQQALSVHRWAIMSHFRD